MLLYYREALFEETNTTDYEDLGVIQRHFDPYVNLWVTAQEWFDNSKKWLYCRFVDLDAEDVEKCTEKYFSAITKACKWFAKADLKEQNDIANLIKGQITEFRPEVPMLVTLRNPGEYTFYV